MVAEFLLVALISSLACSADAQTQCALTASQKFDPSCEGIVSDLPTLVLPGVEFTASLHPQVFNGTLHVTSPTNASIFASTNDFCGPSSFSEGVVCSSNGLVISPMQNIRFRLTCEDTQQTQLEFGPTVLVLGFPAPYACSVQLNTTWTQSKERPINVNFAWVHEVHVII